jgi:hypothetical protein
MFLVRRSGGADRDGAGSPIDGDHVAVDDDAGGVVDLTTAGMPNSRATVATWERTPPVSTTTGPVTMNSGVHGASVNGATKISPAAGRERNPAWAEGMIRLVPVTGPLPTSASRGRTGSGAGATGRRAPGSSGAFPAGDVADPGAQEWGEHGLGLARVGGSR